MYVHLCRYVVAYVWILKHGKRNVRVIKWKCNGICNTQRTSNVITSTRTHTQAYSPQNATTHVHTYNICVWASIRCRCQRYLPQTTSPKPWQLAHMKYVWLSLVACVCICVCVCDLGLRRYPQAITSAHIYIPRLWLFSVLTYITYTYVVI